MKAALVSFYGSALSQDTAPNGSILRLRLLLEYLDRQGIRCRILSFGSPEGHHRRGPLEERCRRYPFRAPWRQLQRGWARVSRRGTGDSARELLHVLGLGAPCRLEEDIRWVLEGADVVHQDYPWMLPDLLPRYRERSLPVILTCHNVEWLRFRQAFSLDPVKKALWGGLLERRFKAFELAQMAAVDQVVPVSDSDARVFREAGHLGPMTVVPNPIRPTTVQRQGAERSAIFVGAATFPNRRAASRIAQDIAPAAPELTFTIVGSCGDHLQEPPPNVHIAGVLTDAQLDAAYARHAVALIPLRDGSGSSLKTIEAAARHLPVVTTRVGLRGFEELEQHVFLADETPDLVGMLRHLAAHPAEGAARSREAAKVAARYLPDHIYRPYIDVMQRLAPGPSGGGPGVSGGVRS